MGIWFMEFYLIYKWKFKVINCINFVKYSILFGVLDDNYVIWWEFIKLNLFYKILWIFMIILEIVVIYKRDLLKVDLLFVV